MPLCVTSCQPAPDPTIDGSVFVVTQGGENFKLGLVAVRLIPEKEVVEVSSRIKEDVVNQVKTLEAQSEEIANNLAIADGELEVARGEDEGMRGYARGLREQAFSMCKLPPKTREEVIAEYRQKNPESVWTDDEVIDRHFPSWQILPSEKVTKWRKLSKLEGEALSEMEKLSEIVSDKSNRYNEARSDASKLISNRRRCIDSFEETLFQALPATELNTKTDADGKFRLKVPRNEKFAIAASAQRRAGGRVERYYWLLWIPEPLEGDCSITLSNDNIMAASPSNSVVRLPLFTK